ncbi:precorrin-6A/cobalt-precorrin-6A reductase [Oceanospirillum maris]|uniref:precorrin-6A/cobalt-precorrin-6A reductase n=1 Tax=Oceanospirillum maris TaxID=64977 RepID=UPI0004299DB3|nr:precorrin-6A/cobalt-precorrin-6A reductase [Oceanospirillum maris]
MTQTRILLLGGTSDGRKLAQKLHQQGVTLIYSVAGLSVAGLARQQNLACPVISGGFSRFSMATEGNRSVTGLARFLEQENIHLILDVTHPYAATMSQNAVLAAAIVGIPCWRFHRPAWQAQPQDNWFEYPDWFSLTQGLGRYLQGLSTTGSILLTTGQLSAPMLTQLLNSTETDEQNPAGHSLGIIMRTAAPSRVPLPKTIHWLKAIGPFDLAGEQALFAKYDVRVLVSKNSGGIATEPKLEVARRLNIPVFMLARPTLEPADRHFCTVESLSDAVAKLFKDSVL